MVKTIPNPLFMKWLSEWKDEANHNQKPAKAFEQAIKSLKKFPLVLKSGKECRILEHFSSIICQMLDDKLTEYLKSFGINKLPFATLESSYFSTIEENASSSEHITKKFNENEICNHKENLKSSSNIKKFKANSSVVCTESNSTNSILMNEKLEEDEVTSSKLKQPIITFKSEEYQIFLCIDHAEVSKDSKQMLLSQLNKMGTPYVIKKLNIGDFVWICSKTTSNILFSKDLILPIVIERKRLDDLARSIKDGRYREQKFRLKKCQAKQIIYLIETHKHASLPESTLFQAKVNVNVIDGFLIKETKNINETALYLNEVTKYLQAKYLNKTIYGWNKENLPVPSNECDLLLFDEFNQNIIKNKALTIEEVFAKQLIQCHGLSSGRAKAVTSVYPTPRCLLDAYENCDSEEQKCLLLANLLCPKTNIKVGPKLSKTIYQLFNLDSFN